MFVEAKMFLLEEWMLDCALIGTEFRIFILEIALLGLFKNPNKKMLIQDTSFSKKLYYTEKYLFIFFARFEEKYSKIKGCFYTLCIVNLLFLPLILLL